MKNNKVFLWTLITTMAMAACKKAEDPVQPQKPTYTIGNGGTATLTWVVNNETKNGPSRTEVNHYLANNDTLIIAIDSSDMSKNFERNWTTGQHKVTCDSLEKLISDVYPKTVLFSGSNIYADTLYDFNLWQMGGEYDMPGVTKGERARYENLGINVAIENGRRNNPKIKDIPRTKALRLLAQQNNR